MANGWRGPQAKLTTAPERLAVVFWSVVLLVIFVRVVVKPASHSLYPIFANAGRHWLAGADLYGRPDPGLDHFRYSPLVAAAFAPLSLSPERVGNVVWRLLNAAAYLGGLSWWARVMFGRGPTADGRPPWTAAQIGWLFLLALPLSVGNLNNGQSNILVLGLMLATLAAATEERWNLASVCIAAACLLKVYPISVGLLLATLYPRRFAGRLMLALAVGVALPFLLQRPAYVAGQYAGWLAHMRGDDRQTWPLHLTYRDLRFLFRVWHTPLGPRPYQAIQLAAAALIAALCWLKHRASGDPREVLLLLLSLACCWMTVFGAATESATYVLLAPSAAAFVVQTWKHHTTAGCVAVRVVYGVLLLSQLANWFPFGARFHDTGPQPAAALVFFGYLLIRAVRPGPSRDSRQGGSGDGESHLRASHRAA